jgi:hypothetical protein
MSKLRAVLLPEDIYSYLKDVLDLYYQRGFPSAELLIAGELYKRVSNAQEIDLSNLGKAEISPTQTGVALDLGGENGK